MDAKNGKEVIVRRGCFFPDARLKTLEALNDRAVQLLKTGNAQALPVCLQIVMLDPMHNFDKGFWDNVPK
jgi:hypothetical protein